MNTSYQNRGSHPYEDVLNELALLKKIVLQIKNAPKESLATKYYTRKEISILTKSSIQTIDNYVDKGWIIVEEFGPKKKLIHHYQIFNKDGTLKSFRYKRKP